MKIGGISRDWVEELQIKGGAFYDLIGHYLLNAVASTQLKIQWKSRYYELKNYIHLVYSKIDKT